MVLKMGLKTTFEKKGVVKCRRQRENDRNWGYCEMREKISGLSPHASLSPASGYSWDSSGLESHILHVAVAFLLSLGSSVCQRRVCWLQFITPGYRSMPRGCFGKSRVTCLYFSGQSTWSTKALLKSPANVSF